MLPFRRHLMLLSLPDDKGLRLYMPLFIAFAIHADVDVAATAFAYAYTLMSICRYAPASCH